MITAQGKLRQMSEAQAEVELHPERRSKLRLGRSRRIVNETVQD